MRGVLVSCLHERTVCPPRLQLSPPPFSLECGMLRGQEGPSFVLDLTRMFFSPPPKCVCVCLCVCMRMQWRHTAQAGYSVPTNFWPRACEMHEKQFHRHSPRPSLAPTRSTTQGQDNLPFREPLWIHPLEEESGAFTELRLSRPK